MEEATAARTPWVPVPPSAPRITDVRRRVAPPPPPDPTDADALRRTTSYIAGLVQGSFPVAPQPSKWVDMMNTIQAAVRPNDGTSLELGELPWTRFYLQRGASQPQTFDDFRRAPETNLLLPVFLTPCESVAEQYLPQDGVVLRF